MCGIHTHTTVFTGFISTVLFYVSMMGVCVNVWWCVSCRNLLLNVGPTHDGTIVPAFEERLLEMGAWLKVCVCACVRVWRLMVCDYTGQWGGHL